MKFLILKILQGPVLFLDLLALKHITFNQPGTELLPYLSGGTFETPLRNCPIVWFHQVGFLHQKVEPLHMVRLDSCQKKINEKIQIKITNPLFPIVLMLPFRKEVGNSGVNSYMS